MFPTEDKNGGKAEFPHQDLHDEGKEPSGIPTDKERPRDVDERALDPGVLFHRPLLGVGVLQSSVERLLGLDEIRTEHLAPFHVLAKLGFRFHVRKDTAQNTHQQLGKPHVLLGETVALGRLHIQHAEDRAVPGDGHGKLRLGIQHVLEIVRVPCHVVHHLDFFRGESPPTHTLTPDNALRRGVVIGIGRELQAVRTGIVEKDGGPGVVRLFGNDGGGQSTGSLGAFRPVHLVEVPKDNFHGRSVGQPKELPCGRNFRRGCTRFFH